MTFDPDAAATSFRAGLTNDAIRPRKREQYDYELAIAKHDFGLRQKPSKSGRPPGSAGEAAAV